MVAARVLGPAGERTVPRRGRSHAPLSSAGLDADDVFDFSNTPALFYYLLPWESPTKYPHVSMAIADDEQRDLIDALERDLPAVVVLESDRLGLPSWDGVANQVRHDDVSVWIHDNYRPWAWTHGFTFLQRRDLDLGLPESFGGEVGREVRSTNLLQGTRTC